MMCGALLCAGTSSSAHLVALFRTRIGQLLEVLRALNLILRDYLCQFTISGLDLFKELLESVLWWCAFSLVAQSGALQH